MRALLKSPLAVTLAIVLLGALTQSLQPFDHVYYNVWFKNRAKVVETHTTLVSLDQRGAAASLADQGVLIDRLVAAGARHVFVDRPLAGSGDAAGDAQFRAALTRAGSKVSVVTRSRVIFDENISVPVESRFALPAGVNQAISSWDVNFLGYATSSRTTFGAAGQALPAAAVATVPGVVSAERIYPDFRIDARSVPVVEARAVLDGKLVPSRFAGREIFLTHTDPQLDSTLGYLGGSRVPAALVDIAGRFGAREGRPSELGALPFLALFVALVSLGTRLRRRSEKLAVYTALVLGALLAPGLLREHNTIVSVGPTFLAMALYATLRATQKWRNRVRQTSDASGLPNILALAADGLAPNQDVVAVTISQYEQMLASLPRELHGECARQIARRIALCAGDRQVYDNGNGHFVWTETSQSFDALIGHLEGLRALFAAPMTVGGHVLDTNVHFGVDRNTASGAMTRIQAALASAKEAEAKGRLFEEFGEQRLAQSPWELSLHARIDEGLQNGDIWLALQPLHDFRERRICGAEALIRWNDPERGVIPPDAFILQAERAGRIEAITYWVIAKAMTMIGEINRISPPFQISVNLSARMVEHPGLVPRVVELMRERELEDCSLLTFEVTETFSLANREQAKRNLAELKSLGFRVSIDDFGTGQATLAYLSEIPCDEIKLDRRFISKIIGSERDRQIVESVIGLAHRLGLSVVAEGIEDALTMDMLRRMGCDQAQGYFIARPSVIEDLLKMIDPTRSENLFAGAVNI